MHRPTTTDPRGFSHGKICHNRSFLHRPLNHSYQGQHEYRKITLERTSIGSSYLLSVFLFWHHLDARTQQQLLFEVFMALINGFHDECCLLSPLFDATYPNKKHNGLIKLIWIFNLFFWRLDFFVFVILQKLPNFVPCPFLSFFTSLVGIDWGP